MVSVKRWCKGRVWFVRLGYSSYFCSRFISVIDFICRNSLLYEFPQSQMVFLISYLVVDGICACVTFSKKSCSNQLVTGQWGQPEYTFRATQGPVFPTTGWRVTDHTNDLPVCRVERVYFWLKKALYLCSQCQPKLTTMQKFPASTHLVYILSNHIFWQKTVIVSNVFRIFLANPAWLSCEVRIQLGLRAV